MPIMPHARSSEHPAYARPRTEARIHTRGSCSALCRIGTPQTTLAGRIANASAAGVRCEVANGLLPRAGDTVLLEWPDATTSFAQVVWIGRAGIGLDLHGLVPDFRDRLDTASLGSDSYSRLRALQAAWLARQPA